MILSVIINTLARRRPREVKMHSSLEFESVNELDAVALALDDIITGWVEFSFEFENSRY